MAKRHEIKTVLIIEDEADIRNFASRMLELEGYRVLQAEDGDTGLKLARGNHVDLMLLDFKLPGRDGLAVLAQVKGEPELSAIPVIMFSASAEAVRRDKALSEGAADYLVKPLSVASLKEAITRILRQNR